MSEKLSVEARAVMDLTSRENATYLDVLHAVLRMEAAAEERGRVEKLTLADAKVLAMEARTESLRVVLTEAAKAQQEASDVTFAMASESGRGWDPDAHLMPIAEAILGAEERGRRRGLEERDDLRAALKSAAVALNVAEGWLTGLGSHTEAYQVHGWHRKALAALAPRDSGKET